MLWLVPSITALLIKCVLFFYTDVRKQYYLFYLLCAFFALNTLELTSFFRFGYDLLWLKSYYFVAIFCMYYLLRVSAAVAEYRLLISQTIVHALLLCFGIVFVATDIFVAGFKLLPNGSITRIAGPYYAVFQFYSSGVLLLAIALLVSRLIYNNNYYLKARCIIALLSFAPTVSVFFIITCLMHLGYQVNMVGFLSLSTCFMLLIFVPLSNKAKLFHAMKFVPFSREWRYYRRLKTVMKKFHRPMGGEPVAIKPLMKELEALVISQTHNYFATQKEVAHMLTLSESNISKKSTSSCP
ncbi:hypothetical protein CBF23_013445 [Marinomonas agarivorans]|nr:hypothetical protein CBF23_013445 [Marinomonas agarivorans]